MARWTQPTQEQIECYREWVASRPEPVRAIAEKFDPWTLYRLKDTGHRVQLLAFAEGPPVTLRVAVGAEYNHVLFERDVFGISPDDLEECDLPGPEVPTGALLTQSEVRDNIDALRVTLMPDKWEMVDGKAVAKNAAS